MNKIKLTKQEKPKTLSDYFPKYSVNEIKRALSLLDLKYIGVIEDFYGKDLTKTTTLKPDYKQGIQLIVARYLLKNKLKQTETKLKLGQLNLIDYFSDYTYNEIKIGISKLPEKHRCIIRKVFGEHLRKTNDLKLTRESQLLLLEAIKELDKNYLSKTIKPKLKNFYEYFNDETKDEIKLAFSLLSLDYQEILIKAYGEDFIENNTAYLSTKERRFLSVARADIKRKIKKIRTNNSYKLKKLFDYYPEYNEEEILKAFSILDVRYKNIIEKAYGKNLNEIKKTSLSKKEKELLKTAKSRLLKQLQNFNFKKNIYNFLNVDDPNDDFLSTLEESTLKDLEYIFKHILGKKNNLSDEENKYYSAVLLKLKFLYAVKDDLEVENNSEWEVLASHFDKEKSHNYIMTLNPTTQVIINAKLGFLDGQKIYSYKTISEATQIPIENIYKIVMNTLWDIRNFIAENDYVKKPTKK